MKKAKTSLCRPEYSSSYVIRLQPVGIYRVNSTISTPEETERGRVRVKRRGGSEEETRRSARRNKRTREPEKERGETSDEDKRQVTFNTEKETWPTYLPQDPRDIVFYHLPWSKPQRNSFSAVLPCLLRSFHCHTTIKVTMWPTTTRVGNTFPGGLTGIGPGYRVGRRRLRRQVGGPGWKVRGSGGSEGGGVGGPSRGVVPSWTLNKQPSCSRLTREREQSERASPPSFFFPVTQSSGTNYWALSPSLFFHNPSFLSIYYSFYYLTKPSPLHSL